MRADIRKVSALILELSRYCIHYRGQCAGKSKKKYEYQHNDQCAKVGSCKASPVDIGITQREYDQQNESYERDRKKYRVSEICPRR